MPATSLGESAASERVGEVVSALADKAVDFVAIAPSDNLSYVLGFSPLPDERLCLLLLSERGAVFVVPTLNAEQSAGSVSGLEFLTGRTPRASITLFVPGSRGSHHRVHVASLSTR